MKNIKVNPCWLELIGKPMVDLVGVPAEVGGNNLLGDGESIGFLDKELAIWFAAGVAFNRVLFDQTLHEKIVISRCKMSWHRSVVFVIRVEGTLGISILIVLTILSDHEGTINLGWSWGISSLGGPWLLDWVWSESELKRGSRAE